MRQVPALTAAALITATPVLAQVTAEDVWQNLQAPVLAMGGQMTAATTRKGNQLEVGETSIVFALPYDVGNVMFTSTGVTLAENGDGTVTLLYPSKITGIFAIDGEEGGFVSARFELNSAAYNAMATGTPGDIRYDYSLDSGEISLTDVDIPEATEVSIDMTGTMTGMRGTYSITEGDILRLSIAGNGGEMAYDLTMVDNLGTATVSSQKITGGTSEVTLAVPTGKVSILNLPQALRDGLAVTLKGEGTHLEVKSETQVEGFGAITQNYGYLMDDIEYQVDESGLVGSGVNSDVWFEFMFGPEMPIPAKGAVEKITGSLVMPLNKTDGLVDADLAMVVDGFTMEEALWAMFDPTAQLPRDPMGMVLDVSTKVEIFIDLLDIAGLVALEDSDEAAGAIHALTLNDLVLDMAGALMTGKGAFTFDNNDFDTFDGIPAPDGTLKLEITGANGLIDRLLSMGLLIEEQAIGARMMMSLLTVPGNGDDMLTSKIEVKPDGQVLANGQRLK